MCGLLGLLDLSLLAPIRSLGLGDLCCHLVWLGCLWYPGLLPLAYVQSLSCWDLCLSPDVAGFQYGGLPSFFFSYSRLSVSPGLLDRIVRTCGLLFFDSLVLELDLLLLNSFFSLDRDLDGDFLGDLFL